jgi:hypothetical protein
VRTVANILEDSATLAKLDLLTVARDRARLRGNDKDLPILGSLVDCWESITITEPEEK